QGFLWIGTRDGLNRFDGYDFEVYNEINSNLGSPNISALHKGKDNKIWVGTQSAGLYLYEWAADAFTPLVNIEGDSATLSNNGITSIAEGGDGLVWVGTNGGGLNNVDSKTLKVQRYHLGPELMRIKALEIDQNENLWIGSFDGLYYFETNKLGSTGISHFDPENVSPSDHWILSLHIDILGRLWVGTRGSGLYYFDNESKLLRRLDIKRPELTISTVRKITSLPDGKILLCTGDYGVLIVDPVSNKMQSILFDPDNDNSLINNSVYDILYDRFGSMWIANASGGVNYFNRFDRKFSTITHVRYKPNSLSNSNARSFYQDRQGRIWIGTRAGVNLSLDGDKGFKKYKLVSGTDGSTAELTVLSMLEDSQGRFWIGTFSRGARILDRENGKHIQFKHPDDLDHTLDQVHVYDILEDNDKNIWFATLGGVYVLDHTGKGLKRYTVSNSSISHNSVKVLMQDSNGGIWLGTSQGLNYYNPEKKDFESLLLVGEDKAEINNYHVFCLYENDNGEIWVGTEGGGIKIINHENSTIRTIGIEFGLPDNTINAIEKDNNGNFWISTNKGLCQVNEESGKLITFSREDGLQADDFFPGASLHTREGEMYFGGPMGLNRFRPSDIEINPQFPEVVFTKLYLKSIETNYASENTPLDKPLPLTDELILSHRQTSFSIYFAGLGYINPEKYQYSYFLEGFDNDWGPYGKQRFATYTNLDHGNYILKVRVKNNDNQPGGDIAELKIFIHSAPWVTWWAYLIYLSIISVLLILFRYYIISWTNVTNELEFEKREKKQIKEV
ncbi:two-component regulator propeller domain-containing protein, partial [Bacteroidota bacterium]